MSSNNANSDNTQSNKSKLNIDPIQLFEFLYQRDINTKDLTDINDDLTNVYSKDISLINGKIETTDGRTVSTGPIICQNKCKLTHMNIDEVALAEDNLIHIYNNYIFIELAGNTAKHIINYNATATSNGSLSVGSFNCDNGKISTNYSLLGLFIGPTSHAKYDGDNPSSDHKVEVNLVYQNVCNPNIYICMIVHLVSSSNAKITTENSLYSSLLNAVMQNDINIIKTGKNKNGKNYTTISDFTSGNFCNSDTGDISCNQKSSINTINMNDFFPEDHNSFISWLDIINEHSLYWVAIENTIQVPQTIIDGFLNKIQTVPDSNQIQKYLDNIVYNSAVKYNKGRDKLGVVFNNSPTAHSPNPVHNEIPHAKSHIEFIFFYSTGGSISGEGQTQEEKDASKKNEEIAKAMCGPLNSQGDGSTVVINRQDQNGQNPVLVELSADGTAKSSLGEIMTASQLNKLNTNIKNLQEQIKEQPKGIGSSLISSSNGTASGASDASGTSGTSGTSGAGITQIVYKTSTTVIICISAICLFMLAFIIYLSKNKTQPNINNRLTEIFSTRMNNWFNQKNPNEIAASREQAHKKNNQDFKNIMSHLPSSTDIINSEVNMTGGNKKIKYKRFRRSRI